MVILQELAFADGVGGCADAARGVLVRDAAAEVVRVADEIIAEEYGSDVAGEGGDGRLAATLVGFVEDVVVDEGGDVDHFHHSGDGVMFRGQLSGGAGDEQEERGAEHFSAIGRCAGGEFVHDVDFRAKFGVEDGFGAGEVVADGAIDIGECGGGRRGCGHAGDASGADGDCQKITFHCV